MKPKYERENLTITAFDAEDIIVTSNPSSDPESAITGDVENIQKKYGTFSKMPGSWF